MSDVTTLLSGLTAAFGQNVYNLAYDDAFDDAEWPLRQRIERRNCCDLCTVINGRIVAVTDPEYRKWLGQVHLNCFGHWVAIHRDEGHEEMGPDGKAVWVHTRADWRDKPIPPEILKKYGSFDNLLQKQGHFIAEPEKYAALNIPALPGGRTYICQTNGAGQPATLTFAAALPPRLLLDTVSRIAGRTLGVAAAQPELVSAASATLRQCADQVAGRAPADPGTFVRDLGHDHLEYGAGHTRDEFARLPADLLSDPDVAVARGTVTAGAGQHPAVLFRGRVQGVETTVALDTRTGQLTYLNAPADLLSKLPDFQPLKGSW